MLTKISCIYFLQENLELVRMVLQLNTDQVKKKKTENMSKINESSSKFSETTR